MSELGLDTLVIRRHDVIDANVADGYLMLDLESGRYLEFNRVASVVWDLLVKPISLRDIISALTARFEVEPGECERAVFALISQLRTLGIAQVSTSIG